jgi:hypothetical protein
LPLKIKKFIWYLVKGVVLTKDNLAKRQWKGSLKWCSCNLNESIQHLLFDCHVASIFRDVYKFPLIYVHIYTFIIFFIIGWRVDRKLWYKILIGACSCSIIWLNRNDMVFNRAQVSTSMQVLFRGTHWIHVWLLLQKEEERPQFKWGCAWNHYHGVLC